MTTYIHSTNETETEAETKTETRDRDRLALTSSYARIYQTDGWVEKEHNASDVFVIDFETYYGNVWM